MRIERRRSVEVFGVRIRVIEVESAFRTAVVVATRNITWLYQYMQHR